MLKSSSRAVRSPREFRAPTMLDESPQDPLRTEQHTRSVVKTRHLTTRGLAGLLTTGASSEDMAPVLRHLLELCPACCRVHHRVCRIARDLRHWNYSLMIEEAREAPGLWRRLRRHGCQAGTGRVLTWRRSRDWPRTPKEPAVPRSTGGRVGGPCWAKGPAAQLRRMGCILERRKSGNGCRRRSWCWQPGSSRSIRQSAWGRLR